MPYALIDPDNKIVGIENSTFPVVAQLTFVEIPADLNVTTDWTCDGVEFIAPPPPTTEKLWAALRATRDSLLHTSDVYTLPDYPHADESARQAWLEYRQLLRDLPANTPDPASPVWPVRPDQQTNQ